MWTRCQVLKSLSAGAAAISAPWAMQLALVAGGETVRVLLAPIEPGLFMYHCHNLEHEDGGMMRNCQFGASATAGLA